MFVWFKGFSLLWGPITLATAMQFAHTRLIWLFYNGPRLSGRALQALLVQKMQPMFAAQLVAQGEAPRAAAAIAAATAAAHARHLSPGRLFGFVFIVGCALFVSTRRAYSSFLAALKELQKSKRQAH